MALNSASDATLVKTFHILPHGHLTEYGVLHEFLNASIFGCLTVGAALSFSLRMLQPKEGKGAFTLIGVLYLVGLLLYGAVASCAASISRSIG
jgi:hypothetical protein